LSSGENLLMRLCLRHSHRVVFPTLAVGALSDDQARESWDRAQASWDKQASWDRQASWDKLASWDHLAGWD
jgi:hypothetical protein